MFWHQNDLSCFRIWCLWLNFSPSDHLLNFPPSYEKARIPMELASFSLSTASSNNLKWKSSSNLWTISVIIWLFPHKERWKGAIICNVHIWIGENSIKVLFVKIKLAPSSFHLRADSRTCWKYRSGQDSRECTHSPGLGSFESSGISRLIICLIMFWLVSVIFDVWEVLLCDVTFCRMSPPISTHPRRHL